MKIRPHIVGHAKVQSQLERSLAVKNLHSALLFSGPEGIGKKLIAQSLAQTILCTQPQPPFGGCGQCQSCTVLLSGNNPDYVEADLLDKDQWKVDGIRELLLGLSVKPYMQHGRVVIFDNAHALSTTAANILLKTFEEPQEGNYFILISSNPSRLPITLRSRCQVWSFAPLQADELRTILKNQFPSDALSEDTIALADGSVRNARLLVEQAETVSDIKEILRRLEQGDVGFFYEDLSSWTKQKESIPMILHITRLLAREHMFSSIDLDHKALWASFLTDINAADWAITERNLSPLLVLFHTFLRLVPHEISGYVAAQLGIDDSLSAAIR